MPSREGDLRVTDRDIGPGSAPAPHIATYRHLHRDLAAAPFPAAHARPAVRNAYMPRSDGSDIRQLITKRLLAGRGKRRRKGRPRAHK